ncbi:MAG: hypothetical protein IT294_11510 [Deltaproteobacteria bacterium]|nr:hypothetical protein [Deltaproteobacteria bacterium]
MTASATATATPTPTATATPIPTATAATPSGTATATASAPLPTASATPLALGLPDPEAASGARRCQSAFERAGSAFVAHKLGALARCTSPILRCLQSGGSAVCLEKAGARCRTRLARLTGARAKLDAAIVRACSKRPLAIDHVRNVLGLNFDDRAADCRTRFGLELSDLGSIVNCVARQHGCIAERIFQHHVPRAKEMLRVARVDDAALAELPCLPDFGGTGAGLTDASDTRAALRCHATLTAGGLRLTRRRLATLDRCVDAAFACVQTRRDDAGCVGAAGITCRKALARLAAAADKARTAIVARCGDDAVTYQRLRSPAGLGLTAVDPSCAALGHPAPDSAAAYAACALRHHECAARDLLDYEAPRARDLLQALGLTLPAGCP